MSIQSAFAEVCKDAKLAHGVFVSLYRREPFYGGPQEGGWWSADVFLVASQEFKTEESAKAAKGKVEELAKKLEEESKKTSGEICQRQIEFCEARGIDDANTVFGEFDGFTTYFVTVEEKQGENESRGCRHYE